MPSERIRFVVARENVEKCEHRRRRRRHRHLRCTASSRSRDPLAVLRFDGPDSLPAAAEAFPSTLSRLAAARSFLFRCL